jgi:hypothetical protein
LISTLRRRRSGGVSLGSEAVVQSHAPLGLRPLWLAEPPVEGAAQGIMTGPIGSALTRTRPISSEYRSGGAM